MVSFDSSYYGINNNNIHFIDHVCSSAVSTEIKRSTHNNPREKKTTMPRANICCWHLNKFITWLLGHYLIYPIMLDFPQLPIMSLYMLLSTLNIHMREATKLSPIHKFPAIFLTASLPPLLSIFKHDRGTLTKAYIQYLNLLNTIFSQSYSHLRLLGHPPVLASS